MSDPEYVRQYFSERTSEWRALAYGEGDHPVSYPVGASRVRVALEGIQERLGATRGHLVDLGCGGGELALEAAGIGFEVTGIDIAEGMIAAAEARRQMAPPEVAGRIRFRVADALDTGLSGGSVTAVAALGVLEYLDGDIAFFRAAARLLRGGGVLVVSCRNRLFNMASVNEYTAAETQAGQAPALLAELAELKPAGDLRPLLGDFASRLRDSLPTLESALAVDLAAPPAAPASAPSFGQRRRQHTPRDLAAVAAEEGFSDPRFFGIHPHWLHPALEHVAPRFYNGLARALEAFERNPASLNWSSSFLGVFTR